MPEDTPMSTDISDLPDALEEEIELDQLKEASKLSDNNVNFGRNKCRENFEMTTPLKSNLTLDIKKKPYMSGAVVKQVGEIKTLDTYFPLINMKDLMLLLVIYFATTQNSNEYMRKMLSFIGGGGYSHMTVTILKCIILLIIYKIVVIYI
jgi:hypothetical protein